MWSKCGIFVKFSLILNILVLCCFHASNSYEFGVGRSDCTGPPVEVSFLGYASASQSGEGIHLRQYSRAFIVDDGHKRVVFVTWEGCLTVHPVKRDVVEKLQKRFGNQYTMDNVLISASHTHSTPGGFVMNVIYELTTFGFVQQTFGAIVTGIYNSIVRAHGNMQNGRIFIGETEVLTANINRSPTAYLQNPAEERSKYMYDTDETLTQMRFVDKNNEVVGAINWFPIHPTSMNKTNCLVSTDNVGYATLLLEQQMNPNDLPGRGKFVGAFAPTNQGDVSPNIKGPRCEFSGERCDALTSSCPRGEGTCFASGPGKDQFESTKIIATLLFDGAWKIINERIGREISGKVDYIHQFVDMPSYTTTYLNTTTNALEKVKGCLPAMGFSSAAGTTDGPGIYPFSQGTTKDKFLWTGVRALVFGTTSEDIKCQKPKPIFIPTGRASFPYEWQPKIVSTQIFRIGEVVIAAVPAELTTMSGRRLKHAVRDAIREASGEDVQVIVSSLSNMYTSYVATPEEYQVQRYEGSSTIFGPHTLTVYIDQFKRLCKAMVKNESILSGPSPPCFDNKRISLITEVKFDGKPLGRQFGDVLQQPNKKYNTGEQARVLFVSGNPRNDLQHEKTYLTVENQRANGNWTIVAVDSNWETKFIWKRTSVLLGRSTTEVIWDIPNSAVEGNYRIRHFGASKDIDKNVTQYNGTSEIFQVRRGH